MRIAMFGGTFDPIHSAHLEIADAARRQFALDRVLFIPAGQPPHKAGHTAASYADRLRMVELACAGHEGFAASDLERGEAKSYSIHTIDRLRRQLGPEDRLFFLIGADAFAEIETWHRWRELLERVAFLVAARPGYDYPVPAGARAHRLDGLHFDVSSTAIREALARGEEPGGLPAPVLAYIRERSLYRNGAVRG